MKKILICLALLCNLSFADIKTILATPQNVENKDYQLIDIRTPAEWEQMGVVKGAYKISVTSKDGMGYNQNFIQDILNAGINPKKPVALICRSGSRSKMASKILDENGFKEVINLDGGVNLLQEKYNYKLY